MTTYYPVANYGSDANSFQVAAIIPYQHAQQQRPPQCVDLVGGVGRKQWLRVLTANPGYQSAFELQARFPPCRRFRKTSRKPSARQEEYGWQLTLTWMVRFMYAESAIRSLKPSTLYTCTETIHVLRQVLLKTPDFKLWGMLLVHIIYCSNRRKARICQ